MSADTETQPTLDLMRRVARAIAAERDEWAGLSAALQVIGEWWPAEVRIDESDAAVAVDRPPGTGDERALVLRRPLALGGLTIGTLVVLPTRPPAVRAGDDDLLDLLAPIVALALARCRTAASLAGEVDVRVAQLAAQQRFTDAILDALPLGVYVVDRDYRIRAWNRGREAGLQGVARDAALGRPVFDVLHRQPADVLRREFEEVFRTGRLLQFEMTTDVGGTETRYRISKVPMRVDPAGAVTHVITVGEDITAWATAREQQEQAEKLAAVGQLAAGVMHEINNPLATIAASAEMLAITTGTTADATAPSGSARLLGIIELEVARCKRIIDGLLDFARPASTLRAPVDLNGVVQHAALLASHHPRAKRVRIAHALDATLPRIFANADQLVQVVVALLMNAVDASPTDGRVTIATSWAPDGMVRVSVRDDGPGVPRAIRERLFEPFFTTKPAGQGTGLGLAIAWGLVHEHGGTLTLDSDAERAPGATFLITLPVGAAAPPADSPGASAPRRAAYAGDHA